MEPPPVLLSCGISLRPFYFSRKFSSFLPVLYKPDIRHLEIRTGKGNEPQPLPCLSCARLLFFFLFLKSYSSIVDLQCCDNFRCTTKWIHLHTYTHILFLRFFSHIDHHRILNTVPFAIQRSLLANHSVYHSVHMLVTDLQSIPPPQHLSPLVTISLFSKSLSHQFLFCK